MNAVLADVRARVITDAGGLMQPTISRPPLFAVPSGTAMRFVMLVVAASSVALSFVSGLPLVAVLFGIRAADVSAYSDCMVAYYETAMRQPVPVMSTYPQCVDPRAVLGVWPQLAAFAAFWLAVALLYWAIPAWRTRRRRWKPVPEKALSELAPHLLESGVRERVTFLVDPLDLRVTGLALGRVGHRRVVLSGGLLALAERDPETVRAVVLHELAHLRNRDVDLTFLTIAVWRVVLFLLVCNVFSVISTLSLRGAPAFAVSTWVASNVQFLALAGIVPVLRNAVLRSRELYADARATDLGADVRRVLAAREAPHPRALFSTHPSPADRVATLDDTRRLTEFGFWEAASLGCLLTLVSDTVYEVLRGLTGRMNLGLLPAAVLAVLLAFGAGLGVWRASLGRERPDLRRAGAGMVVGLAVGGVCSPTIVISFFTTGNLGAVVTIPWLLLYGAIGWLLLHWLALTVRSWFPVARGPAVVVGVLLATAVPLTLWLNVALQLRLLSLDVVPRFVPDGWPAITAVFMGVVAFVLAQPGQFVIPMLLAFSAIPLLGASLSRDAPGGFRYPLRTGVKVGLLAVVALWFLFVVARVPLAMIAVLAVLVQLVCAVVVSARAAGPRAPAGVIAAFTVGLALFPGGLLALSTSNCLLRGFGSASCRVPANFWQSTLSPLAWSTLLATAAALVTSGVITRRRLRQIDPV